MMAGGTVNSLGMVVYEADAGASDHIAPDDNVGIVSPYDSGAFPAPAGKRVLYHERDTATYQGFLPHSYVTANQIIDPNGPHNPDGETGAVNRFPYTENGVFWIENFNLRGAAPVIPKRSEYGAYGAVGSSEVGDYATYYAQAIAQQSESQVTQEESWAAISGGY